MWVWYKLSRSRAGGAPSLPVVIVISQARQPVRRDPIHTYHTPIPSYRTWISGSPKTVSHAASCCLLGWLVWGRFRRSVRTAQTHVQHASLFHSASLVVGALHPLLPSSTSTNQTTPPASSPLPIRPKPAGAPCVQPVPLRTYAGRSTTLKKM